MLVLYLVFFQLLVYYIFHRYIYIYSYTLKRFVSTGIVRVGRYIQLCVVLLLRYIVHIYLYLITFVHYFIHSYTLHIYIYM